MTNVSYCNIELISSFNKVNSRTHIEQLIELFGNKDSLFQLQNESEILMEECRFQSSWWSVDYT